MEGFSFPLIDYDCFECQVITGSKNIKLLSSLHHASARFFSVIVYISPSLLEFAVFQNLKGDAEW